MTETHIKIGDTTPFIQYVGDGVRTLFPYDFAIFTDANLAVYFDTDKQTEGYTITGVGTSEGGDTNFDAAPANGVLVTLTRETVIKRQSDFQQAGAFFAKTVNTEFDTAVAVEQELAAALARALHLPFPETGDVELPPAAERANHFLGFDNDGKPVAGSVGVTQTQPPQIITLDRAVSQYALTLAAGETVTADDLLIDVEGWVLRQTDHFTVSGGTTINLLIDLEDRDGYQMQVRVISGAGIFGQVADGAVKSPTKFANRPVDLAALALGTPLKLIGYDAAGVPAEVTHKYVGEVWTWGGSPATLPVGNIAFLGQSLAVGDFPDVFAVFGYAHGGAGATFLMPNPDGRSFLYAGQGMTAEGGGLGTARLRGSVGGAETHSLIGDQNGPHSHRLGGVHSTGGGGAQKPTYPFNPGGIPTEPSGLGLPHNNMAPWLCIGSAAIFTGRVDHDYMGALI